MQRLPFAEQLDRYRRSFSGPHLDLVLASMIAGNTTGELWTVPQGDTSPLLLLWDRGNNVFYLAGDPQLPASLDSLAGIITMHARPRAIAEGALRFKTRALSSSLEQSLPDLFPGTGLRESRTLFLIHDGARQLSPPDNPVADMTITPINRDVLTSGEFAYSDQVLAEIRSMWPSEDRFYEHGFGTVAVLEDEIICWCTAEYVSPTLCGIGISTAPRYEGRGIATATASHFVGEARKRGVTAYWECALTNRASVRVAEKAGFVPESEETYWVGWFERGDQ